MCFVCVCVGGGGAWWWLLREWCFLKATCFCDKCEGMFYIPDLSTCPVCLQTCVSLIGMGVGGGQGKASWWCFANRGVKAV